MVIIIVIIVVIITRQPGRDTLRKNFVVNMYTVWHWSDNWAHRWQSVEYIASDHEAWTALRPIAGQAVQWVSEWVSESDCLMKTDDDRQRLSQYPLQSTIWPGKFHTEGQSQGQLLRLRPRTPNPRSWPRPRIWNSKTSLSLCSNSLLLALAPIILSLW